MPARPGFRRLSAHGRLAWANHVDCIAITWTSNPRAASSRSESARCYQWPQGGPRSPTEDTPTHTTPFPCHTLMAAIVSPSHAFSEDHVSLLEHYH